MFKCVLISLLEIKPFVSLKNESLFFWMRVHFKGEGGVKFSKILRGFAHKGGGGGLTALEFFLERQQGVRSKFQHGADAQEDTLSLLYPSPFSYH